MTADLAQFCDPQGSDLRRSIQSSRGWRWATSGRVFVAEADLVAEEGPHPASTSLARAQEARDAPPMDDERLRAWLGLPHGTLVECTTCRGTKGQECEACEGSARCKTGGCHCSGYGECEDCDGQGTVGCDCTDGKRPSAIVRYGRLCGVVIDRGQVAQVVALMDGDVRSCQVRLAECPLPLLALAAGFVVALVSPFTEPGGGVEAFEEVT